MLVLLFAAAILVVVGWQAALLFVGVVAVAVVVLPALFVLVALVWFWLKDEGLLGPLGVLFALGLIVLALGTQ